MPLRLDNAFLHCVPGLELNVDLKMGLPCVIGLERGSATALRNKVKVGDYLVGIKNIDSHDFERTGTCMWPAMWNTYCSCRTVSQHSTPLPLLHSAPRPAEGGRPQRTLHADTSRHRGARAGACEGPAPWRTGHWGSPSIEAAAKGSGSACSGQHRWRQQSRHEKGGDRMEGRVGGVRLCPSACRRAICRFCQCRRKHRRGHCKLKRLD